jgi:death-on-curing protein
VNDRGWVWLRKETVFAIHDEQIAEHGGLPGLRDMALVESALVRPRNLAAYGDPDAAALAAAYAYGLARNHGFSDGNKRTAYVAALVFLLANGWDFTASDTESVEMILALAAGQIEEEALADWFRGNVKASKGLR